jgi:hypothetical protein
VASPSSRLSGSVSQTEGLAEPGRLTLIRCRVHPHGHGFKATGPEGPYQRSSPRRASSRCCSGACSPSAGLRPAVADRGENSGSRAATRDASVVDKRSPAPPCPNDPPRRGPRARQPDSSVALTDGGARSKASQRLGRPASRRGSPPACSAHRAVTGFRCEPRRGRAGPAPGRAARPCRARGARGRSPSPAP